MLKESLAEDEVFVVKFIELVFGNGELAFVWGLEQVLGGVDLKDGFAADLASTCDEEANWTQLASKLLAVL